MINENKLKLSGVANLSAPLELTKSYDLVIKNAEVRKTEYLPCDDGSIDRQYTLKISELSEISIVAEKEVIGAKKYGSQAKVLRGVLEREADEKGEDRESYYQQEMSKIINDRKDLEL